MERREEGLGLRRRPGRAGRAGRAGPGQDVVVGRGLPTVLQLRDLGGGPGQRGRELTAGQPGLPAQLAQPQPEGAPRFVDLSDAAGLVRWQSHRYCRSFGDGCDE